MFDIKVHINISLAFLILCWHCIDDYKTHIEQYYFILEIVKINEHTLEF